MAQHCAASLCRRQHRHEAALLSNSLEQRSTMTKPQLPPCSVPGCDMLAGAVVGAALLCGKHATEAVDKLRANPAPLTSPKGE
jgi:hypothetical protein